MRLSHLCYLAALLFVLGVLLTGCSLDQVARGAHDQAVSAADATMQAGRVGWCDAPTLGAMRRWYGADLEGFRRHLKSCGWDPAAARAATEGGP